MIRNLVIYSHFLLVAQLVYAQRPAVEKGPDGYGLFVESKGWVVSPEYDTIIRFDSPYYEIDSTYYQHIYLLNKDRTKVPADLWCMVTDFKLAKGDGSLISDRTYYSQWQ